MPIQAWLTTGKELYGCNDEGSVDCRNGMLLIYQQNICFIFMTGDSIF